MLASPRLFTGFQRRSNGLAANLAPPPPPPRHSNTTRLLFVCLFVCSLLASSRDSSFFPRAPTCLRVRLFVRSSVCLFVCFLLLRTARHAAHTRSELIARARMRRLASCAQQRAQLRAISRRAGRRCGARLARRLAVSRPETRSSAKKSLSLRRRRRLAVRFYRRASRCNCRRAIERRSAQHQRPNSAGSRGRHHS